MLKISSNTIFCGRVNPLARFPSPVKYLLMHKMGCTHPTSGTERDYANPELTCLKVCIRVTLDKISFSPQALYYVENIK